MKIGIIDCGGGYRGIYAAGVLDYCLENKLEFDLALGISAGSANIISYVAGQEKRNYKFYTEYGLRKEYASAKNFLTKGSFVDLDYVYSTLSNSNGEYPLDYEKIKDSKMEVYIQATSATTGNPVLFSKDHIKQDDYSIFKASSCLPVVCPPYEIDKEYYYDGGISNPIPYKKAFSLGCDKLVILLTLPKSTNLNHKRDVKVARLIEKKFPKTANKLKGRAKLYRKELDILEKLEKSGKVLIISPKEIATTSPLSRDLETLNKLYSEGMKDGEKIKEFFIKNNKLA